MTPAYGTFAQLPGARRRADIEVDFAGSERLVGLYEVPGDSRQVTHYVLDHPLFALQGPGRIYTDDDDAGPFAADATKFAFFCAAACAALARGALPMPSVLHLHDWQTALVLLLRAHVPEFAPLRAARIVYTIHNLAMQGVRPLRGYDSALETWYPDLEYDEQIVVDPRWSDCVNPMAIGIRLADAINTVSPTYAREILEPSDPARGYSGGEGLEDDLRAVKAAGKLTGILNGCTYPEDSASKPTWEALVGTLCAEVCQWIAREPSVRSAHYLADKRLAALPAGRPATLLTSIGRLTEQKARLFRERTKGGASALESILASVGPGGLLVMVGSGARDYERYFSEMAARHERFLFINGYSEEVAQSLYASGDL
ncbi:MAG TPA: glycogen/starch synthase, partial [Gammaproteobacteria bacterium]|nr:glycogen/starch synthase [Gammaproteobacteria bacterium]